MTSLLRAARSGRALLPLLLAAAALLPGSVSAQSEIVLGSTKTAVADPPVAHPATQPVTVLLFHDFTYTDFASRPFTYTPPAGHIRHWAKIILVADFSVSAGRQFDRTGEISIGHTNVYFGTTAEPSDKVSPSWHIERDLTDDMALLRTAHPGETTLGNIVDSKYTGVIHGTASLLFYPVAPHTAPPSVPDLVLSLPANGNGIGSVSKPTDVLTETFTLPTNIVRAYLDLITESQGNDEFWYLNVPDSLTETLKASGRTAFREAEVTVDGAPAGVAPIYPWIYTGGIDPGLWRPIPGVQTLNFVPYRIDLTPFAGLLNNSRPHKIGVRIYNNNDHFQLAGTLLLFRDPVLKTVHGALTRNTLTADPTPVIESHLVNAPGEVSGPVSVTSSRRSTIAGYVLTSTGKVGTSITQTVSFSSVQQFTISDKKNIQSSDQLTTVSSVTETQMPSALFVRKDLFRYPFTVSFGHVTNPDGSATQTTAIRQIDMVSHETKRSGILFSASQSTNVVSPTDTLDFDAAGKMTHRSQHSTQIYLSSGPGDLQYKRTLTVVNGIVTNLTVINGILTSSPATAGK
ncbi:MAG: peptide-N4-asparagine amidase [Janthinobacterium lividum]